MDLVNNQELGELHSRRDTTYSMLKELEFDFQSGILTEEDYRDLEARYKSKAIAILSDIDAAAAGTEVEDEIEKQVQKLRRAKSSQVNKESEKEIQKRRRGKVQFCTQCGAKVQPEDRFCSHCGIKLRQGGKVD